MYFKAKNLAANLNIKYFLKTFVFSRVDPPDKVLGKAFACKLGYQGSNLVRVNTFLVYFARQ